ncbi:hypothetical protein PVAND_005923 [Polypedilum vanderplanki]|uniref:Uncharacterized protein n=1 Tax=Polypedilum vanderplanki TaxID=319348 RepID=A0A9J6C2G9_POLVA|nr:hypothetical protein PVAND_005923 [Polypedilum vanderplanki]
MHSELGANTTSRSVFVSVDIAEDSRGGNVIVTTNRTISTEPYIIRGIRATDLNGTGGDILFLNPSTGLGQTFLNVRVTSQMAQVLAGVFDIFVNSAYTKSIFNHSYEYCYSLCQNYVIIL